MALLTHSGTVVDNTDKEQEIYFQLKTVSGGSRRPTTGLLYPRRQD